MMRFMLFVGANLSVVLLLSIVMWLFDVDQYLATQGLAGELYGLLIMAAVIGFTGSFISLALSKWMAKRAMRVTVIEQPRSALEQWLVSTVRQHANRVGIGMPEVGIFEAPQPNAFATGMNRHHALVAVSSGLLQMMDQDEVEAVIGHEISHIANGDMVTMGLLQGVLNTFVVFLSYVVGLFVDRVLLKNERGFGVGYYAASIITQLVLGVLAAMIAAWFSRRREFRADQGGANLAGSGKMISALQALQRRQQVAELPGQLAAFGIAGGGIGAGLRRLLMSHPPLEERIAALRQ